MCATWRQQTQCVDAISSFNKQWTSNPAPRTHDVILSRVLACLWLTERSAPWEWDLLALAGLRNTGHCGHQHCWRHLRIRIWYVTETKPNWNLESRTFRMITSTTYNRTRQQCSFCWMYRSLWATLLPEWSDVFHSGFVLCLPVCDRLLWQSLSKR